MRWKPDKDRPICPQICEYVCVSIASGDFVAEQKLPSVRELALEIGVNPNTVQRSYEILEQQGIIYTERNFGRYVNKDITIAKRKVSELAKLKTIEYLRGMASLGYSTDEVKEYINKTLNEEWSE